MTRPNSLPIVRLYGEIPITPGCNGPILSEVKGTDTPCCARCLILRQRIYRTYGFVSFRQEDIQYAERLSEACPEAKTSYVVSVCGKKAISAVPYMSELEYESVRGFLQKQFLFRAREGYVSKTMDVVFVTMTEMKLPVYMSHDKILETYGGDEGVKFKDIGGKKYMCVVNMEEAYKSGKWIYIVNYYAICSMLYGSILVDLGEFLEFKGDSGKWMLLFE
jgi:hypothetical protein